MSGGWGDSGGGTSPTSPGWGEPSAAVSRLAGFNSETRYRRVLLNRGWIPAFDFACEVMYSIKTFIAIQLTLEKKGVPIELANWVARDCEPLARTCVTYYAPAPLGPW